MDVTAQIPACGYLNCINAMSTVGHNGIEPIPHPRRTSCRPLPTDGVCPVEGVGPDTPTKINENGASQSDIPYSFHTMPVRAVMSLAQLQTEGDKKYGAHDWRGISVEDHVNHAITHLMAWLAGDRSDNHLQHGAWRAIAALEENIKREAESKKTLDYWSNSENAD
jgi:hypothetical protein